MASGIGPSNMSQLLSFRDIPQCKSLHGRFFRHKELIVGSFLQKIAIDSMQDTIDQEMRLTLDDEKEYEQYKQGNLRVGITVSFGMGWNKRSSSNRYDSLSGHAY